MLGQRVIRITEDEIPVTDDWEPVLPAELITTDFCVSFRESRRAGDGESTT